MDTVQKFRHEIKYVISTGELTILKNRLKSLLQLDANAVGSGYYSIRSLYFDDYHNRCFYENENGYDPREKFRIRIYNASASRITLECKRKEREKTRKTSCPLSIEQTRILMSGKPLPNAEQLPPLLKKFNTLILSRGLSPAVIVEYVRVPFVYKNGNVRVTLDMNISSSSDIGSFLDEHIVKRPIMPFGHQLLEVKYDEYLPDFIHRHLQLGSLRQTAFSKFYLCRKFSFKGDYHGF